MDRYIKLSEWIIKEVEGTLTPEEFGCMKQLLSSDPQALDFYVNSYFSISFFMEPFHLPQEVLDAEMENENISDSQLWKALAEIEKNAETIEIAPSPIQEEAVYQSPVQAKHRVSRLSLAAMIMSMAALLLLLVFVYLNPRTSNPAVGILAETVDAQWRDNAAPASVGQDLRVGVLRLQQGLAQIRFDSGASVILEGPAQVELLSGNSMSLQQGKIVATVGRDAIGFVVNTPQGKILDLGTEFGIRVDPVGQSQVHVFQGEVVLYPTNDGSRLNVSQGSAKSVGQDGEVMDIPLQTAAFVRADEMSSKLLAHTGNSYYRWKALVFGVHRDPSLVAHYFYTKDETQPESLLNAAVTTDAPTGHFGGDGRTAPTWVQGRWPEKQGVRFERGKNQAIIIPADPALSINGPVTISTWVYYPNKTQMGGHLISCRQDYHVNFQFSIFDRNYVYEDQWNRFEFLRFNQQKEDSCYSREFIQQPQTWYHFVMTYDMKNVYFYVNGKLFESKPYIGHSDAKETEIVIGAMRWKGRYVLPVGDFDGIVDDLMIFNRSLSAAEIEKIYEAGTPVSKRE
jgi:hypothetical protein